MTPSEYRKKHKRCATCEYWKHEYTDHWNVQEVGICKAKMATKYENNGMFCRVYKPKEFE